MNLAIGLLNKLVYFSRKTNQKYGSIKGLIMVVHFETFFLSEISVTKDGNECSCDNVVTRQQHYFCRFLAQSFRGQWRSKRLYNNGQDIPRRCLFSSSSSTFDKSTSADPILPKNAGLLLIGSFLCPKAGKTNKSRHSMLYSRNLHRCHTIRKVKFLSKNSILTKPQHFHQNFF